MIVLLTALVGVGPLTTDLYLPSLPNMARAFVTSSDKVQLTVSVFMVAFGLAQLVYGPLSDRYGRRPVLLAGLALYAVAGLACTLATTIEALIALRAVQAFGACSAPVLARAIVRDLFAGARAVRALSLIGAAMALAPVVGPLAGGVLEERFGWRAGFVVLTAFGVALFAVVWARLAETNRHRGAGERGARAVVAGYAVLFGNRTYVGFVAGVAFSFAGLLVFISESSFVLIDHMGLGPAVYGASFGTVAVGYMAGNLVSARLSGRHAPLVLARAGAAVSVGAGALMTGLWAAGLDHPVAIVVPMCAYLAGFGLVMPNAVAGAIEAWPQRAGAASALLGFSQMIVSAACAFAVSRIPHDDQAPMVLAIAAVAVLSLGAFSRLLPRPNRRSRS